VGTSRRVSTPGTIPAHGLMRRKREAIRQPARVPHPIEWKNEGMSTLSLIADEVVEMPLEALALRILRDVDETNEWNSYNWMNARQQSPEFSRRSDALRAFEEAWAWLRAKALVAHDPSQSHEAAIFITRRGRQALEEGLALTRAEERLDVDPHPRIAQKVRSQFLLGEYELAALAAFREVEIRVRALGKV
jgi:hypothetical protein